MPSSSSSNTGTASPRRSRPRPAPIGAGAGAELSQSTLASPNNDHDNMEEELDHLLTDGETKCMESPQTFVDHTTVHVKVAACALIMGLGLGCALLLMGVGLPSPALPFGVQSADANDKNQHEHARDFDFDSALVEENRGKYFTLPNVIVISEDGDSAVSHGMETDEIKDVSNGEVASESENEIQDKPKHQYDDGPYPATESIHPQCIHRQTLASSKKEMIGNDNSNINRPLLILKYARTGSTWFVWSGNTLRLRSGGQQMVWTSEAEGCGEPYSDDLMMWWEEYYNPTDRDVRMRLNNREDYQNPKCPLTGKTFVDYVTKGLRGHERKHDRKTELGSFVSTIDWKISVREDDSFQVLDWQTDDPYHREGDNVLGKDIPNLMLDQWKHLFAAVPNLALGVLIRTNSVKRAISRLASEEQVRICGGKKLHGDEECLKELPEKLHINTTLLFEDIVLNDMKRTVLPKMVAELSSKFGDGKMYCISYESMQRDIAGQMDLLGQYLGDDIDAESLETLRRNAGKTSYKRGSDDLREYLANYDEVRESLAKFPCLLDQLEDSGRDGRDFPPCDLWKR